MNDIEEVTDLVLNVPDTFKSSVDDNGIGFVSVNEEVFGVVATIDFDRFEDSVLNNLILFHQPIFIIVPPEPTIEKVLEGDEIKSNLIKGLIECYCVNILTVVYLCNIIVIITREVDIAKCASKCMFCGIEQEEAPL